MPWLAELTDNKSTNKNAATVLTCQKIFIFKLQHYAKNMHEELIICF